MLGDDMRETDQAALAMVLLSEAHDCSFRLNGQPLRAPKAMMSSDLVTDLMKVGIFSLNLQAGHSPRDESKPVSGFGAQLLIATGFDYAIEAVPRAAGDPLSINLEDLRDHVRRIEGVFGTIPVDQYLVSRVTMQANDRNNFAPEHPTAAGSATP